MVVILFYLAKFLSRPVSLSHKTLGQDEAKPLGVCRIPSLGLPLRSFLQCSWLEEGDLDGFCDVVSFDHVSS